MVWVVPALFGCQYTLLLSPGTCGAITRKYWVPPTSETPVIPVCVARAQHVEGGLVVDIFQDPNSVPGTPPLSVQTLIVKVPVKEGSLATPRSICVRLNDPLPATVNREACSSVGPLPCSPISDWSAV